MIDSAQIQAIVGPRPAGFEPPAAFWTQLYQGYQEPERHYHTFAHVAEVAGWYRRVAGHGGWERPHEVFLAVLFHDVVYVVGAKDNEAKSAEQARVATATWLPDAGLDTNYVAALIELTAQHGSLMQDQVSEEVARFLDCDMAILSAEPDLYKAYEAKVAREYQTLYPEPLYRQGRAHFLRTLLARDRIYLSDEFHTRLDGRARDNLQRALVDLS